MLMCKLFWGRRGKFTFGAMFFFPLLKRSMIRGSNAFSQACKAEDDKYIEVKAKLKQEILALREKVLDMISENESLPDIEKLERQEFILDMEDYQRMLAEEEKLISQVREEIELSNLAAMFLRAQIKKECWDNMVVKGKTIKVSQNCSHFITHTSMLFSINRLFKTELRCTTILLLLTVRLV